jgi:F0F1-type ATP synthase assembly protein I
MPMEPPDPSPNPKSKPSNTYLKYSGLAIQLFGAIGLFGWLGYKLDQYLALTFPAFMLLFGFTAFGAMMFQVYRSIKSDNP